MHGPALVRLLEQSAAWEAGMGSEVELKLSVPADRFAAFRKLKKLQNAQAGDAVSQRLEATYFDTASGALEKAGFALRLRRDGAAQTQTLKRDGDKGQAASVRDEYEAPVADGVNGPQLSLLPETVREEVEETINGESLAPSLTTIVDRETLSLTTKDGDLIEAAFDTGEVIAGDRSAPLSEVELELKAGAPGGLYRFALQLLKKENAGLITASKSERGLALKEPDRFQAVKAGSLELEPQATVEEAFERIIQHCFSQLMANHPVVVYGRSVEGLHQLRVSLRRMRSAFWVFRPRIRDSATRLFETEAKWFAQICGAARDHDVFLEEVLGPVLAEAPDDAGLLALKAASEKVQAEAWEAAVRALTSGRFARFALALSLYLEERNWREHGKEGKLTAPVEPFAGKMLSRVFEEAEELGLRLEDLTAEERHELRKRLKKVRYTLAFFVSLYPPEATDEFRSTLSEMQDVFGALNDVATAEEIVAEISDRGDAADAAEGGRKVLAYHHERAESDWQAAQQLWQGFYEAPRFWLDDEPDWGSDWLGEDW